MIIEVIPAGGLGHAPLRLEASQVLIKMDDGTPIAVAAHYGPDRTVAVESIAFNEVAFHRMLRMLGVQQTVLVTTVRTDKTPPAGARLLAGPA